MFCFKNPNNIAEGENIEDIIDVSIQKQLRRFIDKHQNEKFEDILVRFSEKTGIKRVRCKTFAQSPIVIPRKKGKPLSAPRYYNPEDYFTAIIWEIPPEKESRKPKYEAQYVFRTETNKKGLPIGKRPHPAARKVCTLFKNDYVEFSENGVWKKARIAGYAATKNQIDIRPIFAAKDMQSWIIATSEQVLEKGWKPQPTQNWVSVNVLFGTYSAKVYHGSNQNFTKIDLAKSRDKRDFGKGFYVTTIQKQAEDWAGIMFERYDGNGKYVYEFELSYSSDLKIKSFDTLNKDWLLFVAENRLEGEIQHEAGRNKPLGLCY